LADLDVEILQAEVGVAKAKKTAAAEKGEPPGKLADLDIEIHEAKINHAASKFYSAVVRNVSTAEIQDANQTLHLIRAKYQNDKPTLGKSTVDIHYNIF
jgi:hypothetical protein